MGPRALRYPLMAMQVAAVVTLMRSVALERWITVAACVVLLAGAAAALRGRTWGVALASMLGVTFMGICAAGIAPPWFAVLGFLAIRPFARMWRHFLAFDRSAALALGAAVTALGGLGALLWRSFAADLLNAFPMLEPSIEPQHGFVVAAIGAVASYAGLRQTQEAEREAEREAASATGSTRIRVAEPFVDEAVDEDEAVEDDEAAPARRASTPR